MLGGHCQTDQGRLAVFPFKPIIFSSKCHCLSFVAKMTQFIISETQNYCFYQELLYRIFSNREIQSHPHILAHFQGKQILLSKGQIRGNRYLPSTVQDLTRTFRYFRTNQDGISSQNHSFYLPFATTINNNTNENTEKRSGRHKLFAEFLRTPTNPTIRAAATLPVLLLLFFFDHVAWNRH